MLDLEINFKVDDKYKKMTFRMDRLGIDRLVLDLQIEQYMLDGKTLEEATKLVADF